MAKGTWLGGIPEVLSEDRTGFPGARGHWRRIGPVGKTAWLSAHGLSMRRGVVIIGNWNMNRIRHLYISCLTLYGLISKPRCAADMPRKSDSPARNLKKF